MLGQPRTKAGDNVFYSCLDTFGDIERAFYQHDAFGLDRLSDGFVIQQQVVLIIEFQRRVEAAIVRPEKVTTY